MEDMDDSIQIETTFATMEDAEQMANLLLDMHLIACGQCCEIKSIYNWEGKRHNEGEILLKIKTQAVLWHDCEKLIKKHHPYKLPQITVTGMDGSREYLDWIKSETTKG